MVNTSIRSLGLMVLKIIIAPDSFKECLSASEVAKAIAAGFQAIFPKANIIAIPMADGGEGTLQALIEADNGKYVTRTILGPNRLPLSSKFGILSDETTAIIEMAQAAGLNLVPPDQRDPLYFDTYGVGELILEAIKMGCKRCLISLGGSATVDGGTGMLSALGVRFLDSSGNHVPHGGIGLRQIKKIDTRALEPLLNKCSFIGLCDVNNTLTGPDGAAAVYGPQKGASAKDIIILEEGLKNFAKCIRDNLRVEVENIPGSGAAGGMGAGILGLLKAPLQLGVQAVAQALKLKEKMAGASLLITAEGQINAQTIKGKTPCGVAAIAKSLHIPVIAIAGALGEGYEKVHEHGIDSVFSIAPGPITFNDSITHAKQLLEAASREIAATFRMVQQHET